MFCLRTKSILSLALSTSPAQPLDLLAREVKKINVYTCNIISYDKIMITQWPGVQANASSNLIHFQPGGVSLIKAVMMAGI